MKNVNSIEEEKFRRNSAALYNALAEGLSHAQSQHKAWRNEARKTHGLEDDDKVGDSKVRRGSKTSSSRSLAKLPLVRVADYLGPLLDNQKFAHHKKHFGDHDIRDLSKVGFLRELVREWLATVDGDKRIAGKLASFYGDKEKCAAIAELLALSKIYPNRADIFPTHREVPVREKFMQLVLMKPPSSLHRVRKEVMLGRKSQLMIAIDMFLEFLEIDYNSSPSSQSDRQTAKKKAYLHTYLHEIWKLVDIDIDGFFSEAESFEVTRIILSRPSFGRLITSVWVQKRVSLWVSIQRAILIRVIPSVVRSFVQDVFGMASSSKYMLLKLDTDGDQLISKQEFCNHFTHAFWDVIVIPLVNAVAQNFENALRSIKTPRIQTPIAKTIQTATVTTLPHRSGSAKTNRNCTVVDVSTWCHDMIDSEDKKTAIVKKPLHVNDVEDDIQVLDGDEYFEPVVRPQGNQSPEKCAAFPRQSKSCDVCSIM